MKKDGGQPAHETRWIKQHAELLEHVEPIVVDTLSGNIVVFVERKNSAQGVSPRIA